MKKIIAVIYTFLALFFFSKELICYASSSSDSYVAFDLKEKESDEKKEKDTDEKEEFEEGKLDHNVYTLALNYTTTNFYTYLENSFSTPYYEICSPPPELA